MEPTQIQLTRGETRERERELLVNLGPQHPSTHGVLRIMIAMDGETITWAEPDVGYLHRCFEKLSEAKTYPQVVPFTDRTDYLGPILSEWCYVAAVEKLLELELPPRAEWIRLLVAELQRLSSHFIWWGAFCLDLGAITPFLYSWREREIAYELFEELSGARMLYNYLRIGGVRNDFPPGWLDKVKDFLDYLERRVFPEYETLVTGNRILRWRTEGVAPLAAKDAIAYGATGPVLRGSGVKWDLRKDQPYGVYPEVEFDVPVGKENGDVYDRYLVRMKEMEQSVRICRQAIERLEKDVTDDKIQAKVPRVIKPKPGEVYMRMEGARGEIGCYVVSDGTANPYRVHYRSPCFVHLELIPLLAPGCMLADLVAIIGSIDIVLGEVDR